MTTNHPIFKASLDGVPLESASFAIAGDACINLFVCNNLRLFTGFEDCHGEPIYEGDDVYLPSGKCLAIVSINGCWRVQHGSDAGNSSVLAGMFNLLSLTPPCVERRLKERRGDSPNRRAESYRMARRVYDGVSTGDLTRRFRTRRTP